MIEVIVILTLSILNYQYTRSEMYNHCVSEGSKSKYCESKIKEIENAQIKLDEMAKGDTGN